MAFDWESAIFAGVGLLALPPYVYLLSKAAAVGWFAGQKSFMLYIRRHLEERDGGTR